MQAWEIPFGFNQYQVGADCWANMDHVYDWCGDIIWLVDRFTDDQSSSSNCENC